MLLLCILKCRGCLVVRCSIHKQEVSRGSVVEDQDVEEGEGLPSPGLFRRGRRVSRVVLNRGRGAAGRKAHALGLNKIPVLKQCAWGQVHTEIWNSYEVGLGFVCDE